MSSRWDFWYIVDAQKRKIIGGEGTLTEAKDELKRQMKDTRVRPFTMERKGKHVYVSLQKKTYYIMPEEITREEGYSKELDNYENMNLTGAMESLGLC